MRRLVPKIEYRDFDYPEDVRRIVEACASQDYEITPEVAQWAWEQYSDSMAAGWLCLPTSDAAIVRSIIGYLDEQEF